MTTRRSLTWEGERDTTVLVDQLNKATHSYTIQPVISRNGRVLGKLLICLQEPTGQFGPKTVKEVREMERKFGNVRVIASKSGKMSAKLMQDWVNEVLGPAITEAADESQPPAQNEPSDEPQPSCSWQQVEAGGPIEMSCPERVKTTALVLGDSWGGNTNKGVQQDMKDFGIVFMQIPEGTTNDLQPCDVELFRQWKHFVRKLTIRAHTDGFSGELTSRAGVVNMQSLVYNQFSAPAFEDFIRHSWGHVDKTFSSAEISTGGEPPRVDEIQFSFIPGSKCEHEDCEAPAFMKCAHCSRLLCAKHFLARVCFHEAQDEEREDLSFDDDEFDADLVGLVM